MDIHMAQKNNKTSKSCHQVGMTLRILEVVTLWANRAELYIGLSKEAVRRDLLMMNAPMVLWDYCMDRRAQVHNTVQRPLLQNQEMDLHEATFG